MINRHYKHKYGGLYLVTGIDEEAGELVVHFTHMYPFDVRARTRLHSEFFDGRFTLITADEALEITSRDREELQSEITARKAAAQ